MRDRTGLEVAKRSHGAHVNTLSKSVELGDYETGIDGADDEILKVTGGG